MKQIFYPSFKLLQIRRMPILNLTKVWMLFLLGFFVSFAAIANSYDKENAALACDNGQRIVGYMPSWSGTAQEIQYSKLTHIIYAFIRPTTTGGLTALENSQKLRDIVSRAHAQGVKVLIAVGGWSDLNNTDFQSMAANPTYRRNFINNLNTLIQEYKLDGVDMDWEYPSSGSDPANFATLMHEMSLDLHAKGKLLTAAVAAHGYNADGVRNSVFADVDFLNLMAYDGGDGASHSPYSYAETTLNYWLGRGLPASKAVLGVPFYARPSWKSFRTLLAEGADPYKDVYNGAYYNGITTIKQKAQLAKQRASGIMIWELSQDAVGQYSLLSAINEVIKPCGNDNPDNNAPSVSITSPANNASFTAPASISIAASAIDSDGSVAKVEFFNGSSKLGEDATAPYTFTWSNVANGNYTIVAKATDDKGVTASTSVSVVVKSNDGGGDCTVASWESSKAYSKGNRVSRNGNIYEAKWWTQGDDPAQKSGEWDVWKLIGPCGNGGGTPGNTAPSVSISSPASGAKFTAPASITISASASDSDGTVAKVEFYSSGVKIGEDTSSPYSFTWSNVAAGSYSISAKAIDDKGASKTTPSISVTVDGGSTGTCNAPQYTENGGYSEGSQVQSNGQLYECKPYPYSGWCNGAAWAYEPGKGAYWQDAWILKGSCTPTASVNVNVAETVKEGDVESGKLMIFPNPSNGASVINLSVGAAKEVSVTMHTLNGGKAHTYNFKEVNITVKIQLPSLPQGIYIIKVVADDKVYTEKYLVREK